MKISKETYRFDEVKYLDIPFIIRKGTAYCSICSSVSLRYKLHKIQVFSNTFPKQPNGTVEILFPYCEKCNTILVKKDNVINFQNLRAYYKTYPKQSQLENDELKQATINGVSNVLNSSEKKMYFSKTVSKNQSDIAVKFTKPIKNILIQANQSRQSIRLSEYVSNETKIQDVKPKYNTEKSIRFIAEFKIIDKNTGEILEYKVTRGEGDLNAGFISDRADIFIKCRDAYDSNSYIFDCKDITYEILKFTDFEHPLRTTELKKRCVDLISKENPYPIFICYGYPRCSNIEHNQSLESVIANVISMDRDDYVQINVTYCQKCDRYFIGSTSFYDYCREYGDLLVYTREHENKSSMQNYQYGDLYSSLTTNSKLNLAGYKADAQTSTSERHEQLVKIIEFHMMRRQEIINHLESLVNTVLKNTPNHYNANQRRIEDIHFLNHYATNREKEIYGKLIARAEKFGYGYKEDEKHFNLLFN
jgi:hypothetical protein